MADGLGPDSFDCSGLVVKAASELLGDGAVSWDDSLRHVRDMWSDAIQAQTAFRISQLAVGAVVVTKRQYEIRGQSRYVPGHIGIVTAVSGNQIDFIHANPSVGYVEERPIRTLETLLGYISLIL